VTLFNLGRVDESRDLFEQVLPVFMASGHLYRQAVALGNLASSSFLLGDLSAAERWCRQAIERTDTLADVEAGATDRTILGLIELWTDRWPSARANFESSWRTGLEVGAALVALDAATWLGIGLIEYGEPPAEVVVHARGVAADARVDAVGPQNAGQALLALGYALVAAGDPTWLDEADDAASRAAEALGDSGVDVGVPQCDVLRLTITRARGLDPSVAADHAAAIVARLDRQAVDVSMRPPTVLAGLWEALADSGPDHEEARQQVRALARAYVDRRVAGALEPEIRAGFLAVPSVARLVQLLDAP
jgi:tetratricopeptide (TPR) repeat protein